MSMDDETRAAAISAMATALYEAQGYDDSTDKSTASFVMKRNRMRAEVMFDALTPILDGRYEQVGTAKQAPSARGGWWLSDSTRYDPDGKWLPVFVRLP